MTTLGRLERITSIRSVWPGEETHFTPWLALPENIAVVSDTLGLGPEGLEVEGVELPLPGGGYHADILCRLTGGAEGDFVLIENQFGKSNHDHLGKLLTYASGLKARTVILIGEVIREEHRAALDWLNAISNEEHRFFACELELWRIGDSLPAPRFNVVVQPNEWTRSAEAQGKSAAGVLSETRLWQKSYWEAFEAVLAARRGRVRPVRAQPQSWMSHGLGRAGFSLNTSVNVWENWLKGEIYLSGPNADPFFRQLFEQKLAIETEFGNPLVWHDSASRDRKIYLERKFPDLRNELGWPAQHQWLADTLDALHRVFHERIKALTMPGPKAPQ